MQDYLSQLPAPLPLYILLELPDLKALYAAILSSPCLYAVFRLHAHTIFAKIVERSSTLELVRPIMIYMHLLQRRYHADHDEASSTIQRAELEKAIASMGFVDYTCKNVPTPVIFHMVAQAVRIHDVAYFITRSKLDYLNTLTFQKLADPQDQYRRLFQEGVYEFRGVPLRIPSHLRGPNWVEENRAMRILWILCASWRMHRTKRISTPEPTQIRETLLTLLGLNSELTRHLRDEIVQCLLLGPTLKSPGEIQTGSASEAFSHGFDILQTYHIQQSVYAAQTSEPHLQSTFPQFRRSPAICPDKIYGVYDWGLSRRNLSACDNENRWLRVSMARPWSPLQESNRHVFECLGFSIWDDLRFMTELRLKSIPQFCQPPFPHDPGDPSDPLGQIMESDQLIRLLKVYEHQSQREREGWCR